MVDEVREQGPFDVLVAGTVFDSHAGMARLATLRASGAVPAVVLALGPKPKADLSDIVRTGAVELVEFPTSKRQLAAALKRAFSTSPTSRRRPKPPPFPSSPTASWSSGPNSPRSSPLRRRAGVWQTPLMPPTWPATWRPRPVSACALVDLDLQFGEVSTVRHLRPRFTISDLLSW